VSVASVPVASVQSGLPVTAFERHFVFLCSLMIFASLITSVTEVAQLLGGTQITSVKVVSGLRLIREAIYLVLLLDFVLCSTTARSVPLLNWPTLLFVSVTLLMLGIAAFRAVTLDIALPVILSGMRFLEYVPLALISCAVFASAGSRPFIRIGRWVFIYLIIESAIGLAETRLPYFMWGKTFIGARAFGTFTHPNLFGAAVAFCYVFLYSTLSPRWRQVALVIALFDVVASGSRAGMLGMLAVIFVLLYKRLKNPWTRIASGVIGLLLSPAVLVLGSSSALTGRATGIGEGGGYERLGVWARVLQKLDSGVPFVFGWGMGLGSNTAFALYGEGLTRQGGYISDNTFFFLVGSYGMLGVALALAVLAAIFYRLRHDPIGLAFSALFLLHLLVSQLMETYPSNVLAMIIMGWRLALSSERSSGPSAYAWLQPREAARQRLLPGLKL
jgi:O-Antigen ligase